ncbi:hypothetical protein [Bacillus seohaeanensis]|jgi:hypothetical protein|uniref:Uncharacterized protein n=1 Tax=Bacillus seohaeanensis TaxID=284580 RepID=A0ABW5RQ77_9BACI
MDKEATTQNEDNLIPSSEELDSLINKLQTSVKDVLTDLNKDVQKSLRDEALESLKSSIPTLSLGSLLPKLKDLKVNSSLSDSENLGSVLSKLQFDKWGHLIRGWDASQEGADFKLKLNGETIAELNLSTLKNTVLREEE